MGKKVFLVDCTMCNGCYSCQIGCKDEHVTNDWTPIAKPQPEIGQFWFKLHQKVRGTVPKVKVAYRPQMCMHCDNPPCMEACRYGAKYKRDDGLVIIDPVKCKGCRNCVEACPYDSIFFNEDLKIAQKCTGCAHLLDGDHPICVPRCADNCHVKVIQFGEESEFDLSGTEVLHPEYGTSPRVYYRGLPKRFVAGTVYNPDKNEVYIGAQITLAGAEGNFAATTDDWGDFWLNDLPEGDFKLTIQADGKTRSLDVSTKTADVGLGDIALS